MRFAHTRSTARKHRIRRFGRTYRWHAFCCVPIIDPDGALLKWIGTATDIDDAKAIEAGLRLADRLSTERLQLLELLQSKAPVGMGFVDRQFRVQHMNEALAAANGSTVAAQIGRTLGELVPSMWPELEASYRGVLDDGEAMLDVEIGGPPTIDPADRRRYSMSRYPVLMGEAVIGIGVVAVDITARRQADQVLRFQAELLAAAGQAIVAVDTIG